MKKGMGRLPDFLAALLLLSQLVLPVCLGLSICLDLEFRLYDRELYAVVSGAVMLLAALALMLWKKPQSRWGRLICLFILPAAMMNSLFWLTDGVLALIMACLNVVVAAVLVLRCAGTGRWAMVSLCAVAAIAAVPLLMFVNTLGGLMGEETVLQELDSPNGGHTASVISSDQGALGWSTYVQLQDHSRDVNVLIGQFSLPSQRIYEVEYREDAEDLELFWVDEHTLMINGEAYRV